MADTMDVSTTPGKRGANKILRAFSPDGTNWHPRVMEGVEHLKFVIDGEVIQASLADFPAHIVKMAAAFGLNTTIGNEAGGAEDEDEAIMAMTDRLNALLAGTWATARQAGPRFGDILEAYSRVYRAAGANFTPELRDTVSAKLASGEIKVKDAAKDPRMAAALTAIKMERMQARLAKQQEAAGQAGNDLPPI